MNAENMVLSIQAALLAKSGCGVTARMAFATGVGSGMYKCLFSV